MLNFEIAVARAISLPPSGWFELARVHRSAFSKRGFVFLFVLSLSRFFVEQINTLSLPHVFVAVVVAFVVLLLYCDDAS